MRLTLPKLTPLQSRFAASFLASLLLLAVYIFISHSHFAYAAEQDTLRNEDHNHHRLAQEAVFDNDNWQSGDPQGEADRTAKYEPSFLGADRGIIGRADTEVGTLRNNEQQAKTISPSATDLYVFTLSNSTSRAVSAPHNEIRAAEGEDGPIAEQHLVERQSAGPQIVNITLNVCFQPTNNASTASVLPPIEMYISTTNSNPRPGPGTTMVPVTEGYGEGNLSVTNNLYIAVFAPNLPPGYSGNWNYEIAASFDALPFHAFYGGPFNGSSSPLFLVDSDTTSALLVTRNVSENTSTPANHVLHVFAANDSQTRGLSRSFCAVNLLSNTTAGVNISRTITQRFANDNDTYREQYLVEGLQANTNYTAVLSLAPDKSSTTDSGGGTVWAARSFSTKSMDNCQLIYDLDFCSDTAYSVPANSKNFGNRSALAQWYDSNAQQIYQSFNYSLQQIPCNTTDTARYSLARDCDDCARDYKSWLCAVVIPRCADFSAQSDPAFWYRKPRNLASPSLDGTTVDVTGMTFYDGYSPNYILKNVTTDEGIPLYLNSSRFPPIDTDGGPQPGPYMEILPCVQYCHHIVQSCPSIFSFGCPQDSRFHPLQSRSYGKPGYPPGPNNEPVCNVVGALYDDQPTGSASRPGPGRILLGSIAVVATLILMM